jgi:UDP-glucuronate 4-epimerase
MNMIVTGSAGFIGSELCLRLLKRGDTVIGIDNHNNYYDPSIKESRLLRYIDHKNYLHYRIDISNQSQLRDIFKNHNPKKVINLAAQAGVRYSMENPSAYINSNLVGFANILENCRNFNVEHLVYASTSSVYGANTNTPYSENDSTNHPLSIYAASKKSNELMAHSYSHLFKLPTTGLRFFTVYGPWGRPDMALFKFSKSILEGKTIDVFNNGQHSRDFTYIEDIIDALVLALDDNCKSNFKWDSFEPDPATSNSPWRIFNIGSNHNIKLIDYIYTLEEILQKKAKINFLPLQPGDLVNTYASIDNLKKKYNYEPKTTLKDGIRKFVDWYRNYYNV